MRRYYVYIMSNMSGTLYAGVTSDLDRRVWEHKTGIGCEFTSKYHCTWLVFYEEFADVNQAIGWEKRIKGWTRAKKLALIDSINPSRNDLAATWYSAEQAPPPAPPMSS